MAGAVIQRLELMTNAIPKESRLNGSPDAGEYFRYMSAFVGFGEQEAAAIRETRFIVEKYLPTIIGEFYAHLLRYPPTRRFFQKADGTIDQQYLELRMHHQANFWRRSASGEYDDDFARFVDYVGRAHTSNGADPRIYISERYVIGMVGFVQHAISEAIEKELHELDPELEGRASRAWNLLVMVLLEILARAYGNERQPETYQEPLEVNKEAIMQLAVETYERGLGMARSIEYLDVLVGPIEEIPDGERKIIQVDDLSIGVFHHHGQWYALQNRCLHRAGPVCTGTLDGDTLICPWHGYPYNITTGRLILDHTARLESYPVEDRQGMLYLRVPRRLRDEVNIELDALPVSMNESEELTDDPIEQKLDENEFQVSEIPPGKLKLVSLNGQAVCVYNVDGSFYATQDECTHIGGPMSEGELDGCIISCPWHFSRFDVTNGQVVEGPAKQPLKTYAVVITGEIGKVIE